MESNDLSFWEGEAVSKISERFPNGGFDTWTECKTLLPHARQVLGYSVGPEKDNAKHTLLANLGRYEYEQGNYEIAQSLLEQALAGLEKNFGPEDLNTLLIVRNLAVVYCQQARYDEAERLYQRALTGWEKQLGPEHPETIGTVGNLA